MTSPTYNLIRVILALGAVSLMWQIGQAFNSVIGGISTPLDSYVPQEGTDLHNFLMMAQYWILVPFVIVGIIFLMLKSQETT